jgi:hypothetical protein
MSRCLAMPNLQSSWDEKDMGSHKSPWEPEHEPHQKAQQEHTHNRPENDKRNRPTD